MSLNYRNQIMKKTVINVLLISFLVISLFCLKNYLQCELTDKEAVDVVEKFHTKMNIKYQQDLLSIENERKISGVDSKRVIVGNANEYKTLAEINCKTKEVVHFTNRNIMESSRNKYTISTNNVKHLKWPSFIDEKKAKDILVLLANRIGLPEDAEFADLNLDSNDGIWIGKWKRKYKGISYEKSCMTIAILAVDGEFYSFSKLTEMDPYPAEVKIGRSEAIAIAHKKFIAFFTKDVWEKNKDIFEVKSAELYYSVGDGILNHVIYYSRPRLVWVVVFDAKEGMGRDTVEILIKDKSVIKIDPITGKILNSKIEIVR